MKIAIIGYGNLGRAVFTVLPAFPDMELFAAYTRRDPDAVREENERAGNGEQPLLLPFARLDEAEGEIDCLLVTAASDSDLPFLSPKLAARFHLVDSFDTHSQIPAHLAAVGERARAGGRVAVLSAGWDPGIFSLARLYASAFLPYARTNTFWGEGVSEGHSAAVRHLRGVKCAKAYTIPSPRAKLLAAQGLALSSTERHTRRVFIVAQEGADKAKIEREVRRIPAYFAGYETEVVFLTDEEFAHRCGGHPHRGEVLSVGRTGRYRAHRQTASLTLTLDSNPEFTAGVLLACARAAHRLAAEGKCGAFTLADLPPRLFLPEEIPLERLL